MKIINVENPAFLPILNRVGDDMTFPLSKADEALIAGMKKKLYSLGGVGLAAPQVGISKKLFLVYIPDNVSSVRPNVEQVVDMEVWYNAEYRAHPDAVQIADWEGCYSVFEKMGKVKRFDKIIVKSQLDTGEWQEVTIEGFYARVMQHEIDHTLGKTIMNCFTPDLPSGPMDEMSLLWDKELVEQSFEPRKKDRD